MPGCTVLLLVAALLVASSCSCCAGSVAPVPPRSRGASTDDPSGLQSPTRRLHGFTTLPTAARPTVVYRPQMSTTTPTAAPRVVYHPMIPRNSFPQQQQQQQQQQTRGTAAAAAAPWPGTSAAQAPPASVTTSVVKAAGAGVVKGAGKGVLKEGKEILQEAGILGNNSSSANKTSTSGAGSCGAGRLPGWLLLAALTLLITAL